MHRSISSTVFAMLVLAFAALYSSPARADETIELRLGCTLNDAIRAANTNQPVGACRGGDPGHDHIYVHDTVTILEPPVEITEDLGIVGDRFTSTLDGQGRFSFFHVGPGVNLHIQDLFMSNGFGTSETGQARVESGGRIGFSTVKVINCKGVKEVVAADDAEVHFGHEASVCGKMEPFNPHLPVIPPPPVDPQPDPPDEAPGDNSERPRNRRSDDDDDSSETKVKAAAYTCEHLPEDIIVRAVAGTRSGIQCQAIDQAGVGIKSVIEKGIIAAVDIWGYVEPGVEVCLRGQGELIFLDAAYAPHLESTIASYREGDLTCASFNRAGSLVLVSSAASPLHNASQQNLDNCTLRANGLLNLRDAPAGSTILAIVSADTYYYAKARTQDWFRIAYLGIDGWISADHVETMGDCG